MARRTFLKTSAGAAAAAAAAETGIALGYDTYSIRAFGWKAHQHLEYAAAQKLDTIQFSSLDDFESFDPAYLAKVRDTAARSGISIDGGMGCVCSKARQWKREEGTPPKYLLKGLRVAKALGARSMRCYLGSSDDRRPGAGFDPLMDEAIATFRGIRSEALDLGVKIAVENHAGDMTAREVLTVIEAAGKDLVASCLDTGNPMWVMEDPLLTLEVLGPYVLTTHIRDSAVYEHPRGAAAQWVALGDGTIDFRKFVARFRELCPNAAVQLEIITGRPPRLVPYFDSEYWKLFPKMPAADFARFVALARSGRPYEGPMVTTGTGAQPAEFDAALKKQQMTDLERSCQFARERLGLGIRWRKATA